jgi:hypothetical protein
MKTCQALPSLLLLGSGLTTLASPSAAGLQAFQGQRPRPLAETLQRLRSYELEELVVPAVSGPSELQIVHFRGAELALQLESHSLFSADFQLLVQTETGIEHWPTPPVTTYRGSVLGIPDSRVYASLHEGRLWAQIVLPWQQELWVQPVDTAPGAVPSMPHLIYDRRDVVAGPETCGVEGFGEPPSPVRQPDDSGSSQRMTNECYAIAEIAFDADFEFYASFGSVDGVVNSMTGLLNSVEAIYRDDTEIVYEFTAVLVRTTEPDPFTSTASGCGPPGILQELQAWWDANASSIDRDMTALLSGKDFDGTTVGCAYLGQVCNAAGAYSVEQMYHWGPTYALQVALIAHELGHNWNANHCDADPSCTIMCSGLGGCSGNVSFFEGGSDIAISNFRQGRTCLSDTVYVNASAPGPNFHGTFVLPYPTVLDGASCSASTWVDRREVLIRAGAYNEGVLTLGNFVLLQPVGGVVAIQ